MEFEELQKHWLNQADALPNMRKTRQLARQQRVKFWLQLFADVCVVGMAIVILLLMPQSTIPSTYLVWGGFCVLWGGVVSITLLRERLRIVRVLEMPTSTAQQQFDAIDGGRRRMKRFSLLAISLFFVALMAHFAFRYATGPVTEQDFRFLAFGVFWLLLMGALTLRRK